MTAQTTEKMLAALRHQNTLLERIAAALEAQVSLAQSVRTEDDARKAYEAYEAHLDADCPVECGWCEVEADEADEARREAEADDEQNDDQEESEYGRILSDSGRCERGECDYCKTMAKFDAGEDCLRARCGKDDCRSCNVIDDLTPDAQRHYLNGALDKAD